MITSFSHLSTKLGSIQSISLKNDLDIGFFSNFLHVLLVSHKQEMSLDHGQGFVLYVHVCVICTVVCPAVIFGAIDVTKSSLYLEWLLN